MSYIIGVDGGGTKTESIAYDLNGNVLATSLTGFGNLVNSKDEALNNIVVGIEELVDKFGLEELKGIYLGLAGSEVGSNAQIVHDELKKKFNINSKVMNDGDLALKALLKGEDGILVIAGTGSTSFGIKEDSQARCGGWGNLLADEGSAYKISIEAYKRMIYEYDFGLEESELTKRILNYLEIEKVDDLIDFVYSSTKDEIAKVAWIVSELADKGDEVCISILKTEGEAIAKAAERVYNKLGFDSCKIGLVGSAIRKSNVLKATFEEYLRLNVNITEFVYNDVSPTKGAYYLYKREEE